jgi:hypothetical protein
MIAGGSIWLSILKGRAMDFSKLTLGSKIVAGAGILLLIDSFFHWQEVNLGPYSAGVTMWHGWGVLIALTLLAILAWEALQLTETKIAVGPLSPTMVTMLLAALLVLFTLIKVLSNDYVATWAWVGLVLSIVVGVGAWMNMQEAGESLGDLKSSVAPAGSGTPAPPAEAAPTSGAAPAAQAPVADPPSAPETPAAAPEIDGGQVDTPA